MKLKSLIAAMAVLFVFSIAAMAQDDHHRFEGYAGYSYLNSDSAAEEFLGNSNVNFNSHGFNGSVTGNVSRYVGIKFDYSFHSKSRNFVDAQNNFSASLRTNQFLGGIQIKDNSKEGHRFRPFAHILGGLANQNFSASGHALLPATGGSGPATFDDSVSSNNFAMVIGGGIDLKVSHNVDLRLIQLDYNPIWYRDQVFDGLDILKRTQNNFRIGFGIAFH